MNEYISPVITILTAVIGVAILATLVSRNSNTAGVIGAGAKGFSDVLGTALSPVTGGFGYSRY